MLTPLLSLVLLLQPQTIPPDFPRFIVPGFERQMDSLRDLYYRHYVPAGPLATLWDEWISGPTLWPALSSTGAAQTIRARWADALSQRAIDSDGYVATHQHASIAHQRGWPFPFWAQGGPGTWGWHFSLQGVPPGWHGTTEKGREGWTTAGCVDEGISDHADPPARRGPRRHREPASHRRGPRGAHR